MLPKSNGQHLFRLSYFKNATENVRQREALCLTGRRPPWTTCCDCFGSLAKGVNIETFSAELHRGQGTFHLVVDKVAVAKETFMENGWEAAEENVPAQTLANKPGKAGSRRFLKVVR